MRTKRLSTQSLLSDAELRAAYAIYRKGELSTYDLARQLWERLGYSSVDTCATAIFKGFKRKGWKLRTRSQARQLAVRKYFDPRPAEEKRRERYVRERGEPHRPACGAPSRRAGGRPCVLPAARGSLFCAFHRGPVEGRRCLATSKTTGERCKRLRPPDSDYCGKHREER